MNNSSKQKTPKPFRTYEEQLALIKDQELIQTDEDGVFAETWLRRYGYFALITAYKEPLKESGHYRKGVTIRDVVALYEFDEQLRALTFRYLLRIERHLRLLISYSFCSAKGDETEKYLDAQNYAYETVEESDSPAEKRRKAAKNANIEKLISYFEKELNQSSDRVYVEHYKNNHSNVPLWVIVNVLTFGSLSKMYEYSQPTIQANISKEVKGVNENQLRQILQVLTEFRNICAHDERLFTYRCSKRDIPDLALHARLGIDKKGQQYLYGKRDYFALVISFRYLLPRQEFLEFKRQLSSLIDEVSSKSTIISMSELLKKMGFPGNWKEITRYINI